MAGRGLCGQAQAGLCWGLPLQAGTHSKNPQCLVDSQAQAQAQGSRRGDTVVAATERRVPCAALQAAVQGHPAPGLPVQTPGPASKHSPGPWAGQCVDASVGSPVFRVQQMCLEGCCPPSPRPSGDPLLFPVPQCSVGAPTHPAPCLCPHDSHPAPSPQLLLPMGPNSRPPHCSWPLCLQASPTPL